MAALNGQGEARDRLIDKIAGLTNHANVTVPVADLRAVLQPPDHAAARRRLEQLGARLWVILNYISHGWTDQEIADHLYLSYNTIKTYKIHLYRELGATDRANLVRVGFELGLLQPAERVFPRRPCERRQNRDRRRTAEPGGEPDGRADRA
jgi:DNA-binding NarL/FixJ family response regulator